MLNKLMSATGLGVVLAATAGLGAQAQVAPPDLGPATTEECLSFETPKLEEDGITPVLDELGDPVISQSFECGPDADATHYDSTAVGGNAKATGESSTAYGQDSEASPPHSGSTKTGPSMAVLVSRPMKVKSAPAPVSASAGKP